ncbi:DUF1738 domain-containing protein [Burkholderia cenocepacia]|uniref:ArdC-like ssDNA-binding domain-containing protein n=1 Tax=Burkholderia cenocepacia TaxID=95486 RepID=UPI001B95D6AA|nr:ArdC family protein [Burkholderia cenocepacia]MBR8043375.1 DUF1738 domain-containing protein [Burkholderia cenocepacia]MBR8324540.1 DUF1738 domain-containing protein [Burkholderia cenocepacia]
MAIRTSTSSTQARRARATAASASIATGSQSDEPKVSRQQQCIDAVSAANTWLATRAAMKSPWAGLAGLPRKVVDGGHYTGTNAIILMAAQDALGYRSSLWGSFKALKDKDLKLTKDSRHTKAIFGGFIERRVKAADMPKAGLDAAPAVATAGADSKAPSNSPDDAGQDDGAKRSKVPTLQPIQLFNVAQCEGFLSDPLPQVSSEKLDEIRTQWLACSSEAVIQFARWEEEHPGVDLEPEEVALIVRLATDFAVLRRTGQMDAITEPLPTVPDMGTRFMKACGISWELSTEVADKVYGKEKSESDAKAPEPLPATNLDAQSQQSTKAPATSTEAPATSRAASRAEVVPAANATIDAGTGDLFAMPGEKSGPDVLPAIASLEEVSTELPDWIGVW